MEDLLERIKKEKKILKKAEKHQMILKNETFSDINNKYYLTKNELIVIYDFFLNKNKEELYTFLKNKRSRMFKRCIIRKIRDSYFFNGYITSYVMRDIYIFLIMNRKKKKFHY